MAAEGGPAVKPPPPVSVPAGQGERLAEEVASLIDWAWLRQSIQARSMPAHCPPLLHTVAFLISPSQ